MNCKLRKWKRSSITSPYLFIKSRLLLLAGLMRETEPNPFPSKTRCSYLNWPWLNSWDFPELLHLSLLSRGFHYSFTNCKINPPSSLRPTPISSFDLTTNYSLTTERLSLLVSLFSLQSLGGKRQRTRGCIENAASFFCFLDDWRVYELNYWYWTNQRRYSPISSWSGTLRKSRLKIHYQSRIFYSSSKERLKAEWDWWNSWTSTTRV